MRAVRRRLAHRGAGRGRLHRARRSHRLRPTPARAYASTPWPRSFSGLVIAAAFGSGDFVGGRAVERARRPRRCSSSCRLCSVVGALGVALVVSAHVAPHDIVYGALAGAFNIVGLGLLYHGLAHNSAGVVAPIAAVVGSIVPVAWGLAHGERPDGIVLTGIVVAIAAGAFDRSRAGPRHAGEPGAGDVAGRAPPGSRSARPSSCFAQTSTGSGQWPVFAARVTALTLVAIAALWIE